MQEELFLCLAGICSNFFFFFSCFFFLDILVQISNLCVEASKTTAKSRSCFGGSLVLGFTKNYQILPLLLEGLNHFFCGGRRGGFCVI